ncbi:CCC motif membrane protein [Pedobacter sp. Leaf194]|uniref:CCC motif membrane protein n=1 Tax=Pedobacter sp. Leaf194 TaxID=1736297 RepID=UPI000AB21B0E|nr:CCC motif membrane protein [Pedobacter sp. Leaf194]
MSEEQENPQQNPLEPIKSNIPPAEPVQTPPVTPPPFQQQPPFGQFGNGMGQQNLPNATVALILGILSIPACCCYGLGLVFGIVAWVLAGKDIKQYNLNPGAYSLSSLKNTKAGKVCGIIGVILSALYIVALVAMIIAFGWAALRDPELMKELLREKGLK